MDQAYIYFGPIRLVTPCEFRGSMKFNHPPTGRTMDVCNDGSCPGAVDGRCPFSMGRPNSNGADYFKVNQ